MANLAPAATQLSATLEPTPLPTSLQPTLESEPSDTPRPAATVSATLPPSPTAGQTATLQPSPTITVTPTARHSPSPAPTVTHQPESENVAAPPEIITFTVSPDRVSPGDSVTLIWETEGGESASICAVVNLQHPGECFDVPVAGSQLFTTDQEAGIYLFRLTVANTVSFAMDDTYLCIDASDLFFEDPPQTCGASPPIHSYAAAQRFEHGMMTWIEATDEFLIFYDDADDQTLDAFYVVTGPLRLKPGASVDNRVGDVPADYHEPVSGFGLIWRGEVVGSSGFRDSLGWALEPEFGFETIYQHGIISAWHYFDRYLRDPAGRVRYLWGQAYLGTNWNYVEH